MSSRRHNFCDLYGFSDPRCIAAQLQLFLLCIVYRENWWLIAATLRLTSLKFQHWITCLQLSSITFAISRRRNGNLHFVLPLFIHIISKQSRPFFTAKLLRRATTIMTLQVFLAGAPERRLLRSFDTFLWDPSTSEKLWDSRTGRIPEGYVSGLVSIHTTKMAWNCVNWVIKRAEIEQLSRFFTRVFAPVGCSLFVFAGTAAGFYWCEVYTRNLQVLPKNTYATMILYWVFTK